METDGHVHAETSAPRPLWVIALLGLAPFPISALTGEGIGDLLAAIGGDVKDQPLVAHRQNQRIGA